MELRVPFALVPFGFNSPVKFIIYIALVFFKRSFQLGDKKVMLWTP